MRELKKSIAILGQQEDFALSGFYAIKQSDIITSRVFAPRHFPLTLPSPPNTGERVVEDRVRGRCAIGPVMRLMSLCIVTFLVMELHK